MDFYEKNISEKVERYIGWNVEELTYFPKFKILKTVADIFYIDLKFNIRKITFEDGILNIKESNLNIFELINLIKNDEVKIFEVDWFPLRFEYYSFYDVPSDNNKLQIFTKRLLFDEKDLLNIKLKNVYYTGIDTGKKVFNDFHINAFINNLNNSFRVKDANLIILENTLNYYR